MSLWSRLLPRRDARPLASGTRADSLGQGIPVGGRWVNPASGLGGPHDRSQIDEYVEGSPVDRTLADALIQYNGPGRRVVSREPQDCTREGYDLKGMDPALAEAMESHCDGDDEDALGVLRAIREGRTWARAYGGAAIIPLIDDGRPSHEPLDHASIRAVRGLLVVNRYELPVVDYGRSITGERFAKPRMYQLQPAVGGGSYRLHASRVIRMGGEPLPRHLVLRRQGWDLSIFDLTYAQLRAYGSSHAYAAEALSLLTQGVLQSPSLNAALETEEGPAKVQNRLEAMRMAMGLFGEMAIDANETYTIHARPLSGLGDAIKAAVDALVVVSDMPRAVLLGEMPGGLNRGAISPEMQIWYDHCSSQHREHYTPALRQILKLVFRSHEGPTRGQVPEGWKIEWRPLVQESQDAKADRRVKNSTARATDIACGAVSAAEARAGDRDLQEQYGLDPTTMAEPPLDHTQEPGLVGADDDAAELVGALTNAGESHDPLPEDVADPQDIAKALHVKTLTVTTAMKRPMGDPRRLRWWMVLGKRKVSMREALALVGRGGED